MLPGKWELDSSLVHLATGFKIDVFIQGRGEFDRLEFARHGHHRLEDLSRDLVVKSAENISSIAKENLSAIEQMAKSSEELEDMAQALLQEVASFKV